ncbi:MAG TPA: hypothetical protein VIJ18_18485 [Microbacteriaceae bacterium]
MSFGSYRVALARAGPFWTVATLATPTPAAPVRAMLERMRTAIIGGALTLAGIAAVALRVEPLDAVDVLWNRVWPILLFVGAVIFRSRLHNVPRVFGVVRASVEHWLFHSPLH